MGNLSRRLSALPRKELLFDDAENTLTYASGNGENYSVSVTEDRAIQWIATFSESGAQALGDTGDAILNGIRLLLVDLESDAAQGKDPFRRIRNVAESTVEGPSNRLSVFDCDTKNVRHD